RHQVGAVVADIGGGDGGDVKLLTERALEPGGDVAQVGGVVDAGLRRGFLAREVLYKGSDFGRQLCRRLAGRRCWRRLFGGLELLSNGHSADYTRRKAALPGAKRGP